VPAFQRAYFSSGDSFPMRRVPSGAVFQHKGGFPSFMRSTELPGNKSPGAPGFVANGISNPGFPRRHIGP
jgi:hypothetical protein